MNRTRVSIVGTMLLLILTVICVLMTSHKSAARGPGGGPDVTIVSPLPLPVTGTLSLANGSTPVSFQDVSKRASNLVRLSSDLLSPGQSGNTFNVTPNGVFTPFLVPNDKSLVITSIDVDPVDPGPGTNGVYITSGPHVAAVGHWYVPNDVASQFLFPSGIVFPPGSAVEVVNIPASSGQVSVRLGGYLTSN